jgi:hypothetical protein
MKGAWSLRFCSLNSGLESSLKLSQNRESIDIFD